MAKKTSTPTKIVTVQDLQFEMPVRYSEGHTLTQFEADALNQTFWEAVRNNNRKTIQDAKDVAEAEDAEVDMAELQAIITEYAESYDFSARRTPAAVLDPITKRAIPLARDAIRAKLKAEGRLAEYVGKEASEENKERYAKQIENIAATHKVIRDQAAKLLEQEKATVEAVDLDI